MRKTKHRLLSLMLAAAMALALLPAPVFAANIISDINVQMPSEVKPLGDRAVPSYEWGQNCAHIYETTEYRVVESYWFDDEEMNYPTEGLFTENRTYWLFVRLRVKDGYEWKLNPDGSLATKIKMRDYAYWEGTATLENENRDLVILEEFTLGSRPQPLTVTFYGCGGTPSVPSVTGFYAGNRLHMLEGFRKAYAVPPEGKVFFGWYLTEEAAEALDGESRVDFDYTITEDMPLYAGYVDALYSAALELTLPAAGDELTEGLPAQLTLAAGETGYSIAEAKWFDTNYNAITGAVENDSNIYLYAELKPDEGYGFIIDTDSYYSSGQNNMTVTINGAEITAVPQGNAGRLYFTMRFAVGSPLVHTVTFDGQGRGSFPPLEVEDGKSIGNVIGRNNLSELYGFNLELDGFLLNEWRYEDGTPVDFDAPVTGELTVYADWKELKIVREIDASLQTPRAGEQVPTNSFAALGAGSGVYAEPPEWLDADMQPLASDAVFAADTQYYARLLFVTDRLARFADELTASVNDTDVTASIERKESFVTVLYPFIPSAEPRTGIIAISLIVPEPLAGAEVPVPPQLTLETEGCLLLDAEWRRPDENDDLRPATGVFEAGAEYALSLMLTARDGYAFARQLSVTVNGEPVIAERFYNNLIVYAPFTVSDSVTVTFDSKGGSEVPAVRIKRGDAVAEPEPPEREGWTFYRWYANESYSGSPYNFASPVNESLTLYARWRMSCTLIAYDLSANVERQGGRIRTGASSDTLINHYAYNEGASLSYTAVPDNGYAFRGWRRDDPITGELVSASARITEPVENNLRLYAVFERSNEAELTLRDGSGASFDIVKLMRWEGMTASSTGGKPGTNEPINRGYDPDNISCELSVFSDGADTVYSDTVRDSVLTRLAKASFSRHVKDGARPLGVSRVGSVLTFIDRQTPVARIEAKNVGGKLRLTFTALASVCLRLVIDGREYVFITPGDINLDGEMNANDWGTVMRVLAEAPGGFDVQDYPPFKVNGNPYELWSLLADMTSAKIVGERKDLVDGNDWSTMMFLLAEAWK